MVLERSRVFEAGTPADLEIEGIEGTFPTRLEDVRPDTLLVATPMRQREYVPLTQGRKVVLGTTRRSTPYFYETRVVGTEHADGQQLTVLHRPVEAAGVAPRKAVRVPVSISDGQFWWEDGHGKFGPLVAGSVVDVSAGGFQAMTKGGLPPGTTVLARFTLSRENGYLMTDAAVLRTYERVSDAGVKSYRSHCQFTALPERDRDRLIKFVFQRERELRAKGVF
jgi:c-di-GMP-binding flagellar brake protein YcgR